MRERVLQTAHGTRSEAFGPTEWGLVSAVALMWGSSFLWIDVGLDAFRPPVVSLSRIALGALALGLFRGSRRPVDRRDWPRVVLLAMAWSAIPLLLFPIAQDLGVASSTAGMINGAVPLFAATLAAILLRRMPRAIQIAGLLVGFLGVALVSVPAASGDEGSALGIALALVASAFYALAANLAVPLQQRYGALPVIFRAQLVALVVVSPLGVAAIPGSRWAWGSALAMVVLGVFGTGVAYVASSTLLGRVGPTRGPVPIYLIPVVALILGVAFRDERVAEVAFVGIGLILLGAYLTGRRERPRPGERARQGPPER